MSPEQATGSSEIDARSDVYSLGCVTFEMLSGETPHSGSTAAAIMTNKVSGAPPSVTALRPMTPEGVDRAIQKALQTAPADRFSTAADFASALGGAIQGPQAAAPRSSRRRSRIRKIGIPAGLVAGAVLAAALLWRTTSRSSPPGGTQLPTIAVLPVDHPGTAMEERFARGVHEEVMAHLG
ncbi:MAG: hypothetical protein P8170_21080, partial [Gemmatimonadota bacterium]